MAKQVGVEAGVKKQKLLKGKWRGELPKVKLANHANHSVDSVNALGSWFHHQKHTELLCLSDHTSYLLNLSNNDSQSMVLISLYKYMAFKRKN